MKKRSILFGILILVFGFYACDDSDDEILVEGQVTEQTSGNAIQGAIVQVTNPAEFSSEFSRTDSTGRFSLGGFEVTDVTDISLEASASGFQPIVKDVRVAPGDIVRNFNFDLLAEGEDDSGGDDDGGDTNVEGPPEGAAAIILEEVTNPEIRVQGTGGIVSSQLTFVVQDSAGRPLDTDGAVDVLFSIISGPGGGEQIIPDVVTTNAHGRAVTNLFSGDSSGVVRMRAEVNRADIGLTIRSEPILIAIGGGFPDPDRFFVAPENFNLEGFGVIPGEGSDRFRYSVTASVSDLHGNPVQEGTAVDFRTELAGNIGVSSVTDVEGLASVSLRADGSTPTTHPNGIGFFRVIATTVDADNNRISKSIDLLFTTRFANISISEPVNIPANGSQTISYTIEDKNGNPMAAGSEISVTSSAGIEVVGGNFTLGDFLAPGPGATEFSVTLTDTDDETNNEESAEITITITTPNGNETILGSG